MTNDKLPLIIGSVFTLIGLVILVFGIRQYFQTKSFLKIAKPATGEVIGFDRNVSTQSVKDSQGLSAGTKSTTSYYPKIVFTDQKGQKVEFVTKTGSSQPDVEIGDKVAVLYNPDRPHEARRNEWFDLWFGAAVMSGLGAIFAIVGLLAIIFFPNPVSSYLRR